MKKLGFGLMRLPLKDENDRESIDQKKVNAMVDAFMERGFTYFDTAFPYHDGKSEGAAKLALTDRYPRNSFQLADKMPVWMVNSYEDYQKYFEIELERCGVTYFDYYLLHTLGQKNYPKTVELGGFAFARQMKKEGKAKKIGFSFHDNSILLERILKEHPEMEFVQLQINYLDWENDSIEARKCYEVARKYGVPIIVMEPVKGGSLAQVPPAAEKLLKAQRPKDSIASWAMRYVAGLDGVFMVLSGMSNMQQLEDNMNALDAFEPLSEKEQQTLLQVTDIINSSIAIGCTACQYCVEDCPMHIPIPRYFALYNDQHQFSLNPAHQNYYNNLLENHGKASDCIACGKCEEHCPQKLDIIATLENVALVFE